MSTHATGQSIKYEHAFVMQPYLHTMNAVWFSYVSRHLNNSRHASPFSSEIIFLCNWLTDCSTSSPRYCPSHVLTRSFQFRHNMSVAASLPHCHSDSTSMLTSCAETRRLRGSIKPRVCPLYIHSGRRSALLRSRRSRVPLNDASTTISIYAGTGKLVAIVGELSLLRLYLSITIHKSPSRTRAHLQLHSLSQFGGFMVLCMYEL